MPVQILRLKQKSAPGLGRHNMLELYHNTNNNMVEFRHSFLLNFRKKHILYKKQCDSAC